MILLVMEDSLLTTMASQLPPCYQAMPLSKLDGPSVMAAVAAGKSLVWIGDPTNLPKELWVGSFRPSGTPLAVTIADDSPLMIAPQGFREATISSAFISPPKEMPIHNIDEEARADFLPILEARDRLGRVVGYPGALMSHFAPSLAGGRFDGAECFFFFFDNPTESMEGLGWLNILDAIAARHASKIQVTACETSYAAYNEDERVHIRVRLRNRRPNAMATELRFLARAPGAKEFTPITMMRRVANGHGDTEAVCDFRPVGVPGLWEARVEVCVDLANAETLSLKGDPLPIDRRGLGFMVVDGPPKTEFRLEIDGPRFRFDGEDGFRAGTHYYPSTSLWEWAWRDFRPLTAVRDFAAMKRAGYRIARVWVDPVLDENVLRAMDAAILIAAGNGIVLDICIFNQWTNKIGFERATGEQVLFDFRDPSDFNIVSFSLRNLNLQREYAQVLASRWKDAGNIIFNLANETYVNDPDATQMDPEAVQWDGVPVERGTARDTTLFRRWAAEMRLAMRNAGAKQPIFAGYMFSTMGGGDNTLGNADGEIMPWHSYLPVERTASTLQYMDPASSNRPLLLEEFGTLGWNSEKHYDADAHYALAAGAACAMSYEWGVSWLSREACYWPLPLREALVENPDPRWFPPFLELGKAWHERGVGLCGTPSGLGYGSIYHGTPFMAPAAAALSRLSLMGERFARAVRPEIAYVIVPAVNPSALESLEAAFAALWREKAIFAPWQEANLDALPGSARLAICPGGVSGESAQKLIGLREKGVQVLVAGDESWRQSPALERVTVEPGEGVDVIALRTLTGTLYCLFAKEPVGPVIVGIGPGVTLELKDFALIHCAAQGVDFIEGAGTLAIGGETLCAVEKGRILVSADEGTSLAGSPRLRFMTTESTTVTFSRVLTGFNALDPDTHESFPVPLPIEGQHSVNVDGELVRYVLAVKLEDN